MDYFSATVLVTPVWIALGGLAVLFTRRLLWLYLSVWVLLAIVSWMSGVAQVREQRSFEEREVAVQAEQQQLNAEFQRIAVALRISPNSPHEMILNRMHEMDTGSTAGSATLIGNRGRNQTQRTACKLAIDGELGMLFEADPTSAADVSVG